MQEPLQPDSIRALERVARSQRFRPVFVWVFGLLLTSLGAVGGWVAKMLNDHGRITTLEASFASLDVKVDQLLLNQQYNHQQLLTKLLSDSYKEPGRVIKLERDQVIVMREILRAHVSAYAGEPQRMRRTKESATLKLQSAYNNRVDEGLSPIAVYREILRNASIP